MAAETSAASLAALQNLATQLRVDSVVSTAEAGSGHPSTCFSAAEIVATLFFGELRFDPRNPAHAGADRFVLSKGHAAPILYAAWARAGAFDPAELSRLRRIDSDLEGHPTPRLPFVDVATGSLGQGLAAGVGLALSARLIGSPSRTYVLIGDGEMAEGSVWEAAQVAVRYRLDSLCGIVDVNAFGQSGPAPLGHAMDDIARRWQAFGWHTIVADGHDIAALRAAYAEARRTTGRPTMIVARTVKGKGVSAIENRDGWHGKSVKKGGELERVLAELKGRFVQSAGNPPRPVPPPAEPPARPAAPADPASAMPTPPYAGSDSVATREAWGEALAALGGIDPRVVALDADVKNSTFSDKFEQAFPDRFFQAYIAEQAMAGVAMGLASRGAVPFASTFACFLTRAADFIRMAGISGLNLKLAGSHAGVSIGEDGPSQMGLEDLAMMRAVPGCAVLCPCDGVSTWRLVGEAAARSGMVYIRTARPKTPIIYGPDERFPIGGSKVLRSGDADRVTVVAAGVTVFEALKAHDALRADGLAVRVIDAYSIQPIDVAALVEAARATGGRVVTVEDHYAAGGLGDAVASALAAERALVRRLAIREIPRSGPSDALLDRYGISAARIAEAVRAIVS